MPNTHLITAEQFYSIQGEGPYSGHLAVFLRLGGCNLRCSGFTYKDPISQTHLGCDSKLVWQRGTRQSFDEIIAYWQQQQWLTALEQGAHLIVTGGEPLIQQQALTAFIQRLDQHCSAPPFIEIETNATQFINASLLKRINHINASPKLALSGEPRERAYKLEVLQQLAACDKAIFKFVLQNIEEIDEVIEQYVQPLHLARRRIWLMPEGGTQQDIDEKSPDLVELAKQQHMNFSPRLQINIWGEVTGV